VVLGAYSCIAAATVQIDFSGTTAHSTIVANGLPLSGSVSFDPTAAVEDFMFSSGGVNTVAYALPGTAEFTVDGQSYNYNLSDILLNDSGVVLFILADATDASNSLYLFRQTSNTDLSVIPDVSTLEGFAFLNAQFPDGSGAAIGADIQVGSTSLPEPGAWVMMLLGVGVIGLQIRRKGRAQLIHVS
jgi:PEP-CTERM motif